MKKVLIALLCALVLALSACGAERAGTAAPAPDGAASAGASSEGPALPEETPTAEEPEEEAPEQPVEKGLLTDAPELTLVWEDGSEAVLRPSSYSWNYPEGKEMVGFIACGISPTDAVDQLEPIVLPERFGYSDCLSAACDLRCVVLPEQVTVKYWDGEAEQPESFQAYNGGGSIELDLVHDSYEIVAVWPEDKLEENGFYGEASYIFCLQMP